MKLGSYSASQGSLFRWQCATEITVAFPHVAFSLCGFKLDFAFVVCFNGAISSAIVSMDSCRGGRPSHLSSFFAFRIVIVLC